MKQTATRILSLVLSFVMLASMMTMFTFAANNYVPDDEYYDRIHMDSVIVNPDWDNLSKGDKVSYFFRGKTYEETYDANIHFSTIQAAFDASVEAGNKSPVIVLTPGTYLDEAVITDSVTLVGPYGGIDPNVKGKNPTDEWTANSERVSANEAVVKGVIFVKRTVKTNIEIKFDGVTLFKGFSFIEAGTREADSVVYCENTIINGAGNATYGNYAVTDVFSFANAANTVTSTVNIKNTLVKNMTASNVVGNGIANFTAENVMFTTSQGALLGNADAPANQEPNYVVKNCMFYNNNSTLGVISLDHSLNDNATRTISSVEVADCWFIDGPDTQVTADSVVVSPIYATIVGTKNEINVHDCYFEGKTDYTAAPLSLSLTSAAMIAELKNKIRFNNNVFIGYPTLPDTTGMSSASTIDFTGNFYADSSAKQVDPIYPTSSSYANVYMDYYYLNEMMTVKSKQFEIKSLGIAGAEIDHQLRTATATVDFGEVIDINIATNDPNTTFDLYDSTMTKVITKLDTSTLQSGNKKNVFYAVSRSTTYPSYSNTYTVYLSTFDPSQAIPFEKANTYLLADEVEGLAKGSVYYNTWDGIAYSFTVGKNAFADAADIFAIAKDTVPTIIIPAGEYTKTIYVTASATILGAKHGINPNIPDFENPDLEWAINPDRANADQETILENAVIAFEPEAASSFLTVDGLTFGEASGFADRGTADNTYTTSSVENCIVDGAVEARYLAGGTQVTTILPSIFAIGSSNATEVSTTHKSFRLINLRMTNQLRGVPLGSYFENLLIDGCYFANNTHNQLFSNEVTAPKGQDFYFEMRNSCFYKNSTTNYYFVVNNNSTYSTARKSSRLVFDNNTFYETNTNVNGIFGIRFQGATDSILFTRNNFISTTATAFIPGYENWFIGNSGYKAAAIGTVDPSTLQPLTREMIQLHNNRFIGKVINTTPNIIYTHKDTVWDFSGNYFASSYGKTVAGKAITMTTKDKTFCNSYYSDYAMTNMVTPSDEFKKELEYEFYCADTEAKTFKDTVSASTGTYDFGYEIATFQAKFNVYTDAECTNEVETPVTLAGGDNVFYVSFSSYDGSVKDVYKATITKPASTGAAIEKFGNWKIQGKSIFACIPVGGTYFHLPEIVASVGADYTLYNDAACTNEFTGTRIAVPANVPTQKFIKVVSQDGKTTNVYTLTVLQAENDQAELVAIANGKKLSDTSFAASTTTSEFDIYPEISDGATVAVFDGAIELVQNADGSFTVESILDEKTVDVVVTSQQGTENYFTVTVTRGSDSAAVESIRNMYTNGGDKSAFEAIITDPLFRVVPTLASEDATFALYTDRACTKAIGSDVIVPEQHETVVYMKVTSADGTATNVVKLTIKTLLIAADAGFVPETVYEITDATLNDGTKTRYTIVTDANATKYTFNITAKAEAYATTTFAIFSDSNYSTRIGVESPLGTPIEIPLDGRNTTIYLRVYTRAGEVSKGTEYPVVTIVSPRNKVTYKDQSAIANWAKDEIAFLNDNGYGYFVGDSNGNFNPNSSISRFEVAVVVSKILGVNSDVYKTKRTSFLDNIPKWALPYVNAVKELGIMEGKTATTFNGNDATTRQEFARIIAGTLAIALGEEGTIDEIYAKNQALIDYDYSQYTFADEKDVSGWARSSIKLAVSHYKVMSGSAENGKLYLNPKKAITRQEVAVLVANFSGYVG